MFVLHTMERLCMRHSLVDANNVSEPEERGQDLKLESEVEVERRQIY